MASRLDGYVAGMLRRGLPKGEQFDVLAAWVFLEIIKNQGASTGEELMKAVNVALVRANKCLSNMSER